MNTAVNTQVPEDFQFPTVQELRNLPDSEEVFYQLTVGGFDVIFCKNEKEIFICTVASRKPHATLPNVVIYEELMSMQFNLEHDKKANKYYFKRKENDSDKILRFETFAEMLAIETL